MSESNGDPKPFVLRVVCENNHRRVRIASAWRDEPGGTLNIERDKRVLNADGTYIDKSLETLRAKEIEDVIRDRAKGIKSDLDDIHFTERFKCHSQGCKMDKPIRRKKLEEIYDRFAEAGLKIFVLGDVA